MFRDNIALESNAQRPIRYQPMQKVVSGDINGFDVALIDVEQLECFVEVNQHQLLGLVCYEGSVTSPSLSSCEQTSQCPVVRINAPQLMRPPKIEAWVSGAAVQTYRRNGIHACGNDRILFGYLETPEQNSAHLDKQTFMAYKTILSEIHRLGFPHLLRMWNHFPRINAEQSGLECYKHFCVGRSEAFAECGTTFDQILPAGTAIGTESGPLQVYFLASKQRSHYVENPRQVRAYEYPPVYGPRSPAFARATMTSHGNSTKVLISGTSSIVGHESQHVGDPVEQTRETIRNINALIDKASQISKVCVSRTPCTKTFKVYVRHAEHLKAVKSEVDSHLCGEKQPCFYIQADMCRKELLVEIEGLVEFS